jgi:hypothetical protein
MALVILAKEGEDISLCFDMDSTLFFDAETEKNLLAA